MVLGVEGGEDYKLLIIYEALDFIVVAAIQIGAKGLVLGDENYIAYIDKDNSFQRPYLDQTPLYKLKDPLHLKDPHICVEYT